MPLVLTEKDEIEFRQIGLIVTNVLWVALEYLYLETDSHIKFSIVRLLYFLFVGGFRAHSAYTRSSTDLDEKEVFISKEAIKTFKVWLVDVASWCLTIWIFGRSFM